MRHIAVLLLALFLAAGCRQQTKRVVGLKRPAPWASSWGFTQWIVPFWAAWFDRRRTWR